MASIPRKSDGRRIFTDDYKQEQIGRIWSGEMTIAQLSRKLGIARSLLQRWKRLMLQEAAIGRVAKPPATSPSERRATQHLRDLHVMVGKETKGLELLRAELHAIKTGRHLARG